MDHSKSKKTTNKKANIEKPIVSATQDCYPTTYQRKVIWKALTGISIGIIGLLLVGLIWVVGSVLM